MNCCWQQRENTSLLFSGPYQNSNRSTSGHGPKAQSGSGWIYTVTPGWNGGQWCQYARGMVWKKKGLLMFFICRLAPKLKERFTLAPPFYIFLFSPVCCLLQFIVEANFNLFRHRYTLQLRSPQISLLITFKTCALETWNQICFC